MPRHLAIKSTLNSFFVILGAFAILQAAGYARDAILLETGSAETFIANFGTSQECRHWCVWMIQSFAH